jgi:ketosteroid isomerase-like protein
MRTTTLRPAPERASRRTNRDRVQESPIGLQVELVKRLFEAFARRDVEAALELLAPDVRFMPITAHAARGGEPYVGHAGIREYFEDVAALWQELDLVPLEYEAVLGVVVVIGEVHARGPSGELRAPAVWTWMLRNGLIVEGSVHSDVNSALEALGELAAQAR